MATTLGPVLFRAHSCPVQNCNNPSPLPLFKRSQCPLTHLPVQMMTTPSCAAMAPYSLAVVNPAIGAAAAASLRIDCAVSIVPVPSFCRFTAEVMCLILCSFNQYYICTLHGSFPFFRPSNFGASIPSQPM